MCVRRTTGYLHQEAAAARDEDIEMGMLRFALKFPARLTQCMVRPCVCIILFAEESLCAQSGSSAYAAVCATHANKPQREVALRSSHGHHSIGRGAPFTIEIDLGQPVNRTPDGIAGASHA
jgi:hypothetical protein